MMWDPVCRVFVSIAERVTEQVHVCMCAHAECVCLLAWPCFCFAQLSHKGPTEVFLAGTPLVAPIIAFIAIIG